MKKEPAHAAALFDVDGTLVDTSYLHAVTWWEALRQAATSSPAQDRGLADAHSALYAAYRTSLQPLPGAARLLRACAGRGWTVVLATSAKEDELHALRRTLDADDVDTAKPAPDLVEQALAKVDGHADLAVLIGDTP